MVANRTTVDGDENASCRCANVGRTLDQAADLNNAGYIIHVEQATCVFAAPDSADSRAQTRHWWKRKNFLPVV
jgi:hypothetical protein